MLMGSAGKGIRQVVMHIDFEVIGPLVTDQYNWNMQYVDDPAIKGDCEVVPRGAVTLANRDQVNVRRVEFLSATANPIDANILGIPGRAAILREVAKGLSMPVDEIIPTNEKLEAMEIIRQHQETQAMLAGQSPGGGPQQSQETEKVGPSGESSGGKGANTVSNRTTGGGG